jgi:hypothetical protein
VSFAHEARVIEAHVDTNWVEPPKLFFEGQPRGTLPDEYVAVFIRPAAGRRIYLNQPRHRFAGTVIAQIFTKPNIGTRRAREIADLFSVLLVNKQLVDAQAGTLRFRTPYISDTIEANGWFQLNVSAPYERDVTLSA